MKNVTTQHLVRGVWGAPLGAGYTPGRKIPPGGTALCSLSSWRSFQVQDVGP